MVDTVMLRPNRNVIRNASLQAIPSEGRLSANSTKTSNILGALSALGLARSLLGGGRALIGRSLIRRNDNRGFVGLAGAAVTFKVETYSHA